MYRKDKRAVMVLDAGGTNFVFSALQGNNEIIEPITLPAEARDLDKCLSALEKGFTQVLKKLETPPSAISFAFPGPADYVNGVIGDLPNFPAFRGGVALGPFLEKKFDLPVFINNDGNLFAYGEALAGVLPSLNKELEKAGNSRRYENLMAVTLGTGFGGGVVINGRLLLGGNGAGGDVWCLSHKKEIKLIAEEGASIRGVKHRYLELTGDDTELSPADIFQIAEGKRKGNRHAAVSSFESVGEIAGNTIAEAISIVDGLVVIGGGISNAHKYILPAMVKEMRGTRKMRDETEVSRLQMRVYNLENKADKKEFLREESKMVTIPGTREKVRYDTSKKIGVTYTRLGTSKAISLGAYAFALSRLDQK